MKIANPSSNDKDENVNQWIRELEDALRDLCKLKENRCKALNCTIVGASS